MLADCFPQRFSPVALTRPKVLLPLVNVPLLDYTLEWLASQCTDVRVVELGAVNLAQTLN